MRSQVCWRVGDLKGPPSFSGNIPSFFRGDTPPRQPPTKLGMYRYFNWEFVGLKVGNGANIPKNVAPTRQHIPNSVPNSAPGCIAISCLDDQPGFDRLAEHIVDLSSTVPTADMLLQ